MNEKKPKKELKQITTQFNSTLNERIRGEEHFNSFFVVRFYFSLSLSLYIYVNSFQLVDHFPIMNEIKCHYQIFITQKYHLLISEKRREKKKRTKFFANNKKKVVSTNHTVRICILTSSCYCYTDIQQFLVDCTTISNT